MNNAKKPKIIFDNINNKPYIQWLKKDNSIRNKEGFKYLKKDVHLYIVFTTSSSLDILPILYEKTNINAKNIVYKTIDIMFPYLKRSKIIVTNKPNNVPKTMGRNGRKIDIIIPENK